jgi:magnesium chelatase family protein
MVAIVSTVAYLGLEARAVEVQVQLSTGIPRFVIVGLPDKAVAESRERVRAALTAIGLALPPKVITINLSPADLPKEGSHFDLPIALGLLAAVGAVDAEMLSHYVAVGELCLDGRITASPGVLLAALHASGEEKGLICPAVQGSEAAWAGEVEVLAAPDLLALLAHLKGTTLLPTPPPGKAEAAAGGPDLRQVKGQEVAKRALEIAAAGGHNLLMSGPPGAGKSLLASCLPGILPPLTPSEALEVSMVASVAGEMDGGQMKRRRPFRAPHHSASMPALVGGGLKVRPGEISLAHLGVLFLDELPEFQRVVLDSLRQPLETGTVSVARANSHLTFPARVQLVAAMNPCRCGYLGDPGQACARARLAAPPTTRRACQGRCSIASTFMSRWRGSVPPTFLSRLRPREAPRSRKGWPGPAPSSRSASMAMARAPTPKPTATCSTRLRPRTSRAGGCSPMRRRQCTCPPGATTACCACPAPSPTLPELRRLDEFTWPKRSATAGSPRATERRLARLRAFA